MSTIKNLFVLLCIAFPLFSAPYETTRDLPVLYQGRFRSLEAASQQWLYDISHKRSIEGKSALEIVWDIALHGTGQWQAVPLFWIHYASTKTALKLDPKRDRFSYDELTTALRTHALTQTNDPELAALIKRLNAFDEGFPLLMLPTKNPSADWLPLALLNGKNVTLFSDTDYAALSAAYRALINTPSSEEAMAAFAKSYEQAYETIEHTPYRKAAGKALFYPSRSQLTLETAYYRFPLIELAIGAYVLALLLFFWSRKLGWGFLLIGFAIHTFVLSARTYILGRPPVSNMFETVIYVPWVAIALSLLVAWKQKMEVVARAGCVAAILLLILLKLSDLDAKMENVQAVLDSQFWLLIHVLMVVGSYGAFIVSGLLAHLYLIRSDSAELHSLSRAILTTLFVGVGLLIPGTLLGGVWAAESWGRFWDWDPKESWAFISACVYAVIIHAYLFKKIDAFGLACGAIVGLMAISFTWYGVNYILGTGLHSYGFSQGTTAYYYAYLGAEFLFLSTVLILKRIRPLPYDDVKIK